MDALFLLCFAIENKVFEMNLEQLIEQTVIGLGYELVDFERANNGLLRVFIDEVTHAREVTVEDCDVVSRQLTYLVEVENINYERLEVSSPGMDRPLKKMSDFERFAQNMVSVRLKMPLYLNEADTAGRKNFTGTLQDVDLEAPEGEQLSIVFEHEGAEQVLAFGLADVDKARLVPIYNFKGKQK